MSTTPGTEAAGQGSGNRRRWIIIGMVVVVIVGLAVARELLMQRPGRTVAVLEKEAAIATHQTGRNSGVVHAGIYYPPGSQKATLTKRAIPLLREYAREKRVPYEERGKLVIATSAAESDRLARLLTNARKNGVPGLEVVDAVAHFGHLPGRVQPGHAGQGLARQRAMKMSLAQQDVLGVHAAGRDADQHLALRRSRPGPAFRPLEYFGWAKTPVYQCLHALFPLRAGDPG